MTYSCVSVASIHNECEPLSACVGAHVRSTEYTWGERLSWRMDDFFRPGGPKDWNSLMLNYELHNIITRQKIGAIWVDLNIEGITFIHK